VNSDVIAVSRPTTIKSSITVQHTTPAAKKY